MESTGIQRLFYLSWTVIKLNLLFVLFSLAGGIIFGVGPALQMMTDFILEEGMNYQAITVKRAFESWKAHFKRSNCYFLLFLFTLGFVFYNIYLAVQFTGIMWLIILIGLDLHHRIRDMLLLIMSICVVAQAHHIMSSRHCNIILLLHI